MKSWFSITNKSDSEAEICIYDEIGIWGVTAKDFLNELKSVGNRKVVLRINSPGGEVFDGLAIFNRLSEHKGGVEVRIDGIAASMASVIAMAGAPVKMAENALLMIHNPNGICMGDAEDMRDLADMLDKVKGTLTGAYERKTGKSNEDICAMMDAETWLDANEAKEMGFVDEITVANKVAACVGKLRVSAKLQAREKAIDNALVYRKPSPMPEDNSPEVPTQEAPASEVTPSATVEAPQVPAPVQEPAPVATATADVAEIAARVVAEDRQRAKEIRAWAKTVEALHKFDLADTVAEAIENGTSLADFKDKVITTKFTPKPVITPTDHSGASGNEMKRESFEKMTPYNRAEFCRKGGKIID